MSQQSIQTREGHTATRVSQRGDIDKSPVNIERIFITAFRPPFRHTSRKHSKDVRYQNVVVFYIQTNLCGLTRA